MLNIATRRRDWIPAWLIPSIAAVLLVGIGPFVLATAVSIPAQAVLIGLAVLAVLHGLLRGQWWFAGPLTAIFVAAAIAVTTVSLPIHTHIRRAGHAGDSTGAVVAWSIVLAIALVAITAVAVAQSTHHRR